jgi:small-conductance mechanosensitive channel
MTNIADFKLPVAGILNYPLLNMGESSLTVSTVFLTLAFILAFVSIITKAKNWSIKALSKKPGLNLGNWRSVITLTYYAILGIGLTGILQATGLDLSLLTVLTGAIGIGVGFGMQAIFSNFISGVIILLEKPLKLGDRIEVGAVSGNVQSISVRATTILTNDNVSIIIPNSDFISKQLINWSHSGQEVRTMVSVNVPYDSDPEKVKSLLLQVAVNEPGVLKDPAPTVWLSEFGDCALKFNLLVWTHEYSDQIGILKSLLNFGILKTFTEEKIQMPYPRRDIYVHHESQTLAILGGPILEQQAIEKQ